MDSSSYLLMRIMFRDRDFLVYGQSGYVNSFSINFEHA